MLRNFFEFPEAFAFRGFFIEVIQGETSGEHAIARGGCAVAERTADLTDCQVALL